MRDHLKRWAAHATEDEEVASDIRWLLNNATDEDIHDRFYRELEFGTGGLRGVIGAGSNRMNIYTVRKATQGIANYLNEKSSHPTVAIAYDSRIKSELFAEQAARVLAANRIRVFLYPRLMPTPALSFAVRHLRCDLGICITASHNPAQYNGYKVYGRDGCQITTEAADAILAEIQKVDVFRDVRLLGSRADGDDGIAYIPDSVVDAFLDAIKGQRLYVADAPELKLVYTPLNGAGLECVTRILTECGYSDISVVPEQAQPNGSFPTCPYPNPEENDSLALGIRLAEKQDADLLLATDPDCDRVGVAVKHNGEYVRLSGNEVGVLLLDFICRMRMEQSAIPLNSVAVKTIVTTSMADAVAEHYGVALRNVLTGFKFIGEQIGALERAGELSRFIFGFEESCGYLTGGFVRDKDAVSASLMICDMAAWYRKQGQNLVSAMEGLYQRLGYYLESLDSFAFPGEQGFVKMRGLMRYLRETPLCEVDGAVLLEVKDYLLPEVQESQRSPFPPSDVLQLRYDDEALITIRPSGTEPKLKLYCSVRSTERELALSKLSAYRKAFHSLLNQ